MVRRRKGFLAPYKKANVAADSVSWIIVIVVFVFASVGGLLMASVLNDYVQAEDNFNSSQKQVFTDLNNDLPSWVDGVVAFMAIGLWIVVIVASFFIDSNPVFFVVAVVVAVVLGLVGMIISNFWDDFILDTDIAAITSGLPITNFIFQNLAWYSLLLVVSIGFVLYAKKQNDGF